MSLPSVSIGITTYNRKDLVRRAIESVFSQTYRGPLELVIVDDGSDDGTDLSWANSEKPESIERVLIIRNAFNCGIAYSKNAAIAGGSGELRGLLDSDDYYAPGFVARCVEVLQKVPDVGLVYTDNLIVNASNRPVCLARAINWNLMSFLKTCNIRGDCFLARWSLLEKTWLHDTRLRLDVDYDLFYQMAKITTFRRIPEALHTVTQHNGRTSQDRVEAAYWHAAVLAKHGHSIKHATDRAMRLRARGAWDEAIAAGYEYGLSLAAAEKAS